MGKSSVCEEKVFEEVHETWGAPLRNFLFYRFGSLEKARDITQDAFIKLWENCARVPFDKAKSFLFTTGNRLFLDAYDHQQVQMKFQYRMGGTEKQVQDNPEFVYREEEFKERLEQAVSSLPEKQRAVFLMSRIDKLPNKEIAEVLDLSLKTVESHITASLKALKKTLDELENIRI